jgi:hypothetical protein
VENDDLNNENVLENLKEFLNNSMSENLHILEDEIDLSIQMEYFEVSKKVKESLNETAVWEEKDNLFQSGIPVDDKKFLLSKLASLNSVEAFRTIEKYVADPDVVLKDWSKMALHESRMLIESKLLDENQIFISTGLGGRNNKLRYFFVLLPNLQNFSALQQEIITKEFKYVFEKNQSVVEELSYFENFITLMTLIPIDANIKDIFLSGIQECNQFGDFINERFIVTNVKRLQEKEILDIVSKKEE